MLFFQTIFIFNKVVHFFSVRLVKRLRFLNLFNIQAIVLGNRLMSFSKFY